MAIVVDEPIINGPFRGADRSLSGPSVARRRRSRSGTLADGHTYTISGATDFLSLGTDDFASVVAQEVGVVAATVVLTTPGPVGETSRHTAGRSVGGVD